MTPTDWIQAISMVVLVGITIFYALRTHAISKATKEQSDASVKMAEEMREQRVMASRPVIVQKVVPGGTRSDYFEIYNAGNGPAVQLEMILLDEEKHPVAEMIETFFLSSGQATSFHLVGFNGHMIPVCYFLCQYHGVTSPGLKQIWYQTWLPFKLSKSQRGDRTLIQPGELDFNEVGERQSF